MTENLNHKPFSGMDGQVSPGSDAELYDRDTGATAAVDVPISPDSGLLGSEAMTPEERARAIEEWRTELAKTEDEIQTLRQVLSAKVQHAQVLKRKLGITPIQEFRHDLEHGLQTVRESEPYKSLEGKLEPITHSQVYQKTAAALKTAGQKTAEVTSNATQVAQKKLGDLKNSQMYKSFEEKLLSGYSNVKARVAVPAQMNNGESSNFESMLDTEGAAGPGARHGAASAPVTPATDKTKPVA